MSPQLAGGQGGKGVVIVSWSDSYSTATSVTGSPTYTHNTSAHLHVYQFNASGSFTI
jgi:hypothetical protein